MAILVFSPNGTHVTKPTLEAARTSADCAGKTVVVTSALTAAQSDITAAWPADRALEVKKGGSIGNTAAFTIGGSFTAGMYTVFLGPSVTFGAGAVKEVYPQWWGAKADGTTDDTAAIQAAVNAAQGSTVFIPSGVYKVTATITCTVTDATKTTNVCGNGKGSNIRWYGAINLPIFNWKGTAAGAALYSKTTIERLCFTNGNAATGVTAILTGDSVVGANAGLGNSIIRDNTILGLGYGITQTYESDEMIISGNQIEPQITGITITSGIALVTGNHVRGGSWSGWGITSTGVNTVIQGNTVQGENNNGIQVSSEGFVIQGNYIENGGVLTGTKNGILVNGGKSGYIGSNFLTGLWTDVMFIGSTAKNIQFGPNSFSQSGGYSASMINVASGATGISILGTQGEVAGTVYTASKFVGVNGIATIIGDTGAIIPIASSIPVQYTNIIAGTQTLCTVPTSSVTFVHISFVAGEADHYTADAMVVIPDGQTTGTILDMGHNSTYLTLTLSGLNVQTNNTVGSARTVHYSTFRIY